MISGARESYGQRHASIRPARVPVQLPVSFDTGDAIGEGRISNISRTGALIEYSGRVKTEPLAGRV